MEGGQAPQGPAPFHPHPRNPTLRPLQEVPRSYPLSLTPAPPSQQGHVLGALVHQVILSKCPWSLLPGL